MMDGSGDAQGQNDISESFFAGSQVGLEGTTYFNMSLARRIFRVSDQVRLKSSCSISD